MRVSSPAGFENRQVRWRSHLKTYVPSCAMIVLIIGFHLSKFQWMNDRMSNADLTSVKALNASWISRPGLVIQTWIRNPSVRTLR